MENRIDAVLTDADRDNVLTIINDIRARLPFLIDLTIEDRQSLPKMGDKSRAFVSQALALAEHDHGGCYGNAPRRRFDHTAFADSNGTRAISRTR